MHRSALLLSLLVALQGCNAALTASTPDGATVRKTGGTKKTDAEPARPTVAPGLPTRVVPQVGTPAELSGKVKLVSDMGGSVISNNGGTLVPLTKLIGNNSGGLVPLTKLVVPDAGAAPRRLAQAEGTPPAEALLADAVVQVKDAQGRLLVDASGAPITARTNLQGDYQLAAVLPRENLVLEVPLWNGGQLSAILARGDGGKREVPVSTATSLAAAYVLDRFVKGSQAIFDRLPASEAERLAANLEAVRGQLGQAPTYRSGELADLTDRLRKQAPAVDKALEDIKALLLGAIAADAPALAVPLSVPAAVVDDGAGGYLVAESSFGRIRRVAADGKVTIWASRSAGAVRAKFKGCIDLARGQSGEVYVLELGINGGIGVSRVDPDGSLRRVAGTQQPGADPLGGPATATAIRPLSLWVDAKNTLWIAEEHFNNFTGVPRVMTLTPDGRLEAAGNPRQAWAGGAIYGLSQGPDGSVLAAVRLASDGTELCRLAPGDTEWTPVQRWSDPANPMNDLVTARDGTVYLSEYGLNRISRVAPDGTRTTFFESGGNGVEMKGPADMQALPDGRLRVVAQQSNQVLEIDASGRATVVAGARPGAASEFGIAINLPSATAAKPDGSIIVIETAANTVRRWTGDAFETLASLSGNPLGVFVRGDSVFVTSHMDRALKELGPDGKLETRVFGGFPAILTAEGTSASSYSLEYCAQLFEAPDGAIGWVNLQTSQVVRWKPGTERVELLAGQGGPAGGENESSDPRLIALNNPMGAAYAPNGDLYISDSGNMRIRRVRKSDGLIETIGGVGPLLTFAALGAPAAPGPNPKLADMPLVLPGPLCFDAAGTMYVAELGTADLDALTAVSRGLAGLPLDQLPVVAARVLKVTPDGVVSVVAGRGGRFFADEGAADALSLPSHLTIDAKGRLIITDAGANLVRILPAGSF